MSDNLSRCSMCGRVLKSDKSIARGIGSGCASRLSKGGRPSPRIARTIDYIKGKTVTVGSQIWVKDGNAWRGEKDHQPISDDRLKSYLVQYNLIDENFLNGDDDE